MKRLLLMPLVILLVSQMYAQDETLFGRVDRVGFYIAPIFEYTTFQNQGESGFGGSLGIILEDFYFGFYGVGAGNYDDWLEDNNDVILNIGHAGFETGFTFAQHKIVHPFAMARFGWGVVDVDLEDTWHGADEVFVFTPHIGLELNVTSWFRIAAYGGHRWVDGLNGNHDFTEKDFRNFFGGVSLKFGWFGRSWKRYR